MRFRPVTTNLAGGADMKYESVSRPDGVLRRGRLELKTAVRQEKRAMDETGKSLTVDQALQEARHHLARGELQQADALYVQILQVDPGNAAAWHELGDVAYRAGRR